jgi:hypothetical protein
VAREPLALLDELEAEDLAEHRTEGLRRACHSLIEDAVEEHARRPWWQPLEMTAAGMYAVAQAAYTIWVVFIR